MQTQKGKELVKRLPAAYIRLFSRAVFSQKRQCRQNISWTGSKSEARANRGCTELIKRVAAAPSAINGRPSLGHCKIKAAAAIAAGTVVGSTVEPTAVAVALRPTAATP